MPISNAGITMVDRDFDSEIARIVVTQKPNIFDISSSKMTYILNNTKVQVYLKDRTFFKELTLFSLFNNHLSILVNLV